MILPDTVHNPQPLLPRTPDGHQFVCYADSCSGVPGALHERTFAAVNRVVAALHPVPEFILFPGDEVIGLTADAAVLRTQWRHWLEHEMAWLDRDAIPLYHTTGNHTTYDAQSEAVFREMLPHLPRNGAPGQEGLSYFVRWGNLLLVFVHTLPSERGGEGYVETEWLARVLAQHADARHKLVLGHHPVHPVNGFSGAYQREINAADGERFWSVLVEHGVFAYLCSHILAFDVQVHEGVLQILTGGAGTAHRMPEEIEYLHAVQMALDEQGLRYQVLDTEGAVREWLSWPPKLPPSPQWSSLADGTPVPAPTELGGAEGVPPAHLYAWRFSGTCTGDGGGAAQTLVSGWNEDGALAPLWIGLLGQEQRMSVLLAPQPGRSPHLWVGPALAGGERFAVQVALHTGMGPGGLLWRTDDGSPWHSFRGASAWGAERLPWPARWSVGHDLRGVDDKRFRGSDLHVAFHAQREVL